MSHADYILIIANIYIARSCHEGLARFIGSVGLVIGIVYYLIGV